MATSQAPTSLARLPGYDTAPDIYETPELNTPQPADVAASTSSDDETITRGTASATSDSASNDDDDSSGSENGIVRRRLHPSRARERFAAGAGRVRVQGVDMSERVDGGRKGYRVRRTATQKDEEEGGLERRIARLRVEIEECRVLAGKEEGDGKQADGRGKEVDRLSSMLGKLEEGRTRPKVFRASSGVPGTYPANEDGAAGREGEGDEEVPLGKVADFDARLAVLEQALGLSALEMQGSTTATPPMLPALTLLDQQMSVLMSSSSLSGLDALATRIRKVRQEADEFSASTPSQAADDDKASEDSEGASTDVAITKDDLQALHALYATLPTIQSLAPTVPALLTRLRSLRTLHSSAAAAASELDDVEQRQNRLEKDLQGWREGLERVERAIQEASEANGRNGKVVEGWVKEVETRVKSLGR